MELCNYLLKAREMKGLTQKELAEKLGIASAQLISNWERGLCAPPIKKISSLASILDIKFDPTFDIVMKYKSEVARQKAAVKPNRISK
jgi:transcriptional regulator with XRE-family HTH domain